MSRIGRAARLLLGDISLFSKLVIRIPLYDYQLRPLQSVLNSVLRKEGLEFLLVFPRQSGKNEAVAQLQVYLLNLFQRIGGNMVFGATGDGLGRGIRRLEERLGNSWNAKQWKRAGRPLRRSLGNASVVFLSTHPGAAARGETANWLLVIDEMQDQDPNHIEAVFEPMRAATNATALYIGTVKTNSDALWLKKKELETEEERDGFQRVFLVSPEEVSEDNAAYGKFLSRKVSRLGRNHPIVASEYYNEPLGGQGRLFSERRLALMRGTHPRQQALARAEFRPASPQSPIPIHIATLDVAGQDEAATDPVARLANPGRDYTVAHVFEVSTVREDDAGPTYRALDIFVDHGSRHFQDAIDGSDAKPALSERLLAWLHMWGVIHLLADESGVGAGLTDWLSAKMGSENVTGYNFAAARGKAALGSAFLSVIETGRFQYWREEPDVPLGDGWWFFKQAAECRYSLPAEGQFERDLRWGVPAYVKVSTPAGVLPVHDDRLISAALVAVYDDLYRKGTLRFGRAASTIIPAPDPLEGLTF
jgi:hypothetical protein